MGSEPESEPRPCSQSTCIIPAVRTGIIDGPAEFDLSVPTPTFERYALTSEIAQGGQGIIYRATDSILPRDVAIKVLRPSHIGNERFIRGLANEARVMSYLAHPNITPVYECGICSDERPYYVMKFINGKTLADLLHGPGFSPLLSLKVFSDVCQAVAFAHSRGVIHLDLKPQNVMVGAFGEVHLMDWGLARFANSPPSEMRDSGWRPAVEHESEVNGTLGYMSPEQARGEALTTRTDVFGLGGILCEIILGHAPYQGGSVKRMFDRVRRAKMPRTISGLETSDTDRALVRLAKKCLAFDPADRPANGVAVAREVAAYQETAMERAESDMNRFFELSLDLFCIAGLDGYFRRINQNFPRLLGFSERDLLSRPFLEFVHPDDRKTTVDQMGVLGEGQPVVRFRNRYRTADERIVKLEWTAKAISGEDLIYAVARDVSG